ncbi:MAG: hypothetical protein AAGG44_11920 [Planctomycetota bacterium]
MAKNHIIDWQQDSLLLASVSARGGVGNVDACSLQSVENGSYNNAVSAGVEQLGWGKSAVTVVVCRSMAEVRTISVPRVDSAELPDIIRFQAQRQLANMGDGWTLDYVMLPDSGQEMQTALVGAIPPATIQSVSSVCSAANLQLQKIALRPLEIARQAVAAGNLRSGMSLIVSVCEAGADLIFTQDGQTVLLRNTRLPHESEGADKAIEGEIRRSLLAASGELGDVTISKALVIGNSDNGGSIKTAVDQVLGLTAEYIPLTNFLGSGVDAADTSILDQGNRLVGVCGAGLLPAADQAHFIDFKDPKKRPPPKSKTMQYALAAVAALLVVGAGVSWWYKTNADLDSELELLTAENEEKETLVDRAKVKTQHLAEVKAFTDGSIQYLDAFADITERMPESKKIILAGPTFTSLSNGTGEIRVNIGADSAQSISAFEESVRDEDFAVVGREPQMSRQPTELYKWIAQQTITVRNHGWDLVDNLSTSRRATDTDAAPSADTPVESTADTTSKTEDDMDAQDAPNSEEDSKGTSGEKTGDSDKDSADEPDSKTPPKKTSGDKIVAN